MRSAHCGCGIMCYVCHKCHKCHICMYVNTAFICWCLQFKTTMIYNKTLNKKEERRRNSSPLRWNIVMEGRAKISEIPNGSDLEKLKYLFLDADRVEDGRSYKEIASIIYPEDSWDGGKTPSWYAILRAKHLVSKFKEWEERENMVLYCDLDEENKYFLVYSLQTKEQFKKIQDRMLKIVAGIEERIAQTLATLSIPLKQRQKQKLKTQEHFKLLVAAEMMKKVDRIYDSKKKRKENKVSQ